MLPVVNTSLKEVVEFKAKSYAKNSHCQRERETGKAGVMGVRQIKSGLYNRGLISPSHTHVELVVPRSQHLASSLCGLHLAVGPAVNHFTCPLGEQARMKEEKERQKERKSSSMNRIL